MPFASRGVDIRTRRAGRRATTRPREDGWAGPVHRLPPVLPRCRAAVARTAARHGRGGRRPSSSAWTRHPFPRSRASPCAASPMPCAHDSGRCWPRCGGSDPGHAGPGARADARAPRRRPERRRVQCLGRVSRRRRARGSGAGARVRRGRSRAARRRERRAGSLQRLRAQPPRLEGAALQRAAMAKGGPRRGLRLPWPGDRPCPARDTWPCSGHVTRLASGR